MARCFFIPSISFLAAGGIGYALQAHQSSRKDFIAWAAFAALVIGGIVAYLYSKGDFEKISLWLQRTASLITFEEDGIAYNVL